MTVCFEALEHIDDHEKLLREVKRLLTTDGLFIVSTPNKWVYSDEPKYENPFHVHELYLTSLGHYSRSILGRSRFLVSVFIAIQTCGRVFSNGNSDLAEYIVERNPREFAFVEGDKRVPLYFIALASDAKQNVDESASNLVDISNELLAQKDRAYAVARENLETTIKTQQQVLVGKEQQLTQLATDREQYAQEVVKLGSVVEGHKQTLGEQERRLMQFAAERDRFEQEAAQLRGTIISQQQALAEKDQQLLQFATRQERLAQLAAERDRFEQEAAQLRGTIISQQQALGEKERQLTQLATARVQFAEEAAQLQGAVQSQQLALADKDQQLTQLRVILEQQSQQLTEQETALLRIYQSHGWKGLALYYRVRNGLLPEGTRRRSSAKKIFHVAAGLSKICSFDWYYHQGQSLEQGPDALGEEQVSLTQTEQGPDALGEQVSLTQTEQGPDALGEQVSLLQIASDLSLPLPSTPLVSIIIPVYNQLEFTLRCLKSIQENPSRASAEIIVLDDASQDETPKILPRISGIRYLRNQANLGFLRSCNRAASEARSEYLVFLNNDTEVQKDWLDHMLAVFERDERAGIVGAKLIYPNGCLQDAGGLIWNDGSARNFGRDDDPKKPEYNYLCETDYCAAACIAIKASLFREVNGFDELFEPAYYEDVDLAFKVRAKGYKVLYQPAAQVTHFEGGTCGTDLNSGVKSYQQVNAKKFFEKWREVLKQHCSVENRDLVLARDRRVVGRCLFVDVWLTPDRDSGSIYTD